MPVLNELHQQKNNHVADSGFDQNGSKNEPA